MRMLRAKFHAIIMSRKIVMKLTNFSHLLGKTVSTAGTWDIFTRTIIGGEQKRVPAWAPSGLGARAAVRACARPWTEVAVRRLVYCTATGSSAWATARTVPPSFSHAGPSSTCLWALAEPSRAVPRVGAGDRVLGITTSKSCCEGCCRLRPWWATGIRGLTVFSEPDDAIPCWGR